MDFHPGQRWISTAEPELGLGAVLRVEGRGVQVLFAKAGVLRQYAQESAPLARAEFRPGQRVAGKGRAFLVERVEIRDRLLIYAGDGKEMSEGELDDEQAVSQADERLIAGRVDAPAAFDFRLEALNRRAAARRSPAWGVAAARVDLVPHQLRVAEAAIARRAPRLLLADEVGLGKTIEAGLIMARLLAAGRARRVLVLLPDSLVHQWFIELLRRFNLAFALYDEERCEAIEMAGDGRNPFEDEQLAIVPLGLLEGSARRAQQAEAAGWDLLVVDEAHHLEWAPGAASPRYALVERLALRTPGVILLTATPEQLGRSGHFARLRLLDPARYADFDAYLAEADGYRALSALAEQLPARAPLDAAQRTALANRLADDGAARAALEAYPDPVAADALLDALVDRHGTGRVMLRNRRAAVGGFPVRVPALEVVNADLDESRRQPLLAEFLADLQTPAPAHAFDYSDDARLPWLLGLLEAHPRDKFLLIARSEAKVLALEEALRTRTGVGIARFHESLSIVQRDRNAAWFAAAAGARLLLCSEIGSEGRNFQFAHRLVLWDLPLDPDLLEQRIGRLDRIGQQHPIILHHHVLRGTAQHALARWHAEGVDGLNNSPADGRELLRRFGSTLVELAVAHAQGAVDADQELDVLIAETAAAHAELAAAIAAGRDRLLELAAARVAPAETLRHALTGDDADRARNGFVLRLLEHFGVHHEDLDGGRAVLLDPEYLVTDAFPGLRDGPQQATFERATALVREELPLLRLDHPMIAGALDLLLSGEQGNAAFLVDETLPARTALLQTVFLLECVAERRLDVERFLPPTPLTLTVDTRLQPRPGFAPSTQALTRAAERPVDPARYRKFLAKLVPPMLEQATRLAAVEAAAMAATARTAMRTQLDGEHARLQALRAVNPAVTTAEVEAIAAERAALDAALAGARPRLDAVRFVVSTDFLVLK
ncbi:MAG: RNA polymerase-associated protein RapA [Xanthomonadaceae bacterium]|nr:RNA polymerase-associated protein RapA [Xanthomonadaceae bacterium]